VRREASSLALSVINDNFSLRALRPALRPLRRKRSASGHQGRRFNSALNRLETPPTNHGTREFARGGVTTNRIAVGVGDAARANLVPLGTVSRSSTYLHLVTVLHLVMALNLVMAPHLVMARRVRATHRGTCWNR
jgi:hypothetical protein